MEPKHKLSDQDLTILSMLQADPEISQVEISKRLGLTQPSISVRLRKLKESGALALQAGMNLKKVGLHIAKIDLCVKSNINQIIEKFKKCPYCINGFITSGKFNLTLLFVCEDINTLEAIVDSSLRPLPEVIDLEFSIAIAPIKDLIVPISSWRGVDTIDGEGPCGISCKDCDMYVANRCLGCPATKEYKGTILRKV